MKKHGICAKIIAFVFGIVIALCIGILVIRQGSPVVASVVPTSVAVTLGFLCAALKIAHVAPALGWGAFLGALIVWAPITIVSYFFPIIFVPVLAVYAVLVPVSARIAQTLLRKSSDQNN